MRKILAMCDREQAYAARFQEYLCRWEGFPFEVRTFTSAETLEAYARDQRIELLLIAENALEEEAGRTPASRRILLAEDRDSLSDEPCVYKYQSAGTITRQVLDFYGASLEAERAERAGGPGGSITAILGVANAADRTAFALAAGQVLAEQTSVLYLSLERYAGFDRMLDKGLYGTISDLLYYYRQNRGGLVYRLEGMLQKIGSLSFVAPADNPADFLETDASEWADLAQEILRSGRFSHVILDLGCELPDIVPILSACQTVFLVSSDSVFGQKKEETFLDWLDGRDPSLTGRIRRIPWTCPSAAVDSPAYFSGILDEKSGGQIRKALEEAYG